VISVWGRDYIARVIDWWSQPGNAELALRNLRVPADNDQIDTELYKRLRASPSAQGLSESDKDVLELPCRKGGMLVGPPGTGKTTRQAAVVCAYMEAVPAARILLLSYTNRGIDELMLRVAGSRKSRFKMARVGKYYDEAAYVKYPDLIVKRDDPILSDGGRSNEYYRPELNSVSTLEGVYGMTCFAALHRFDRLSTIDFDLVIIDEASQVPLTQGLALLSLGRSVIIAGDDVQLNPVCKTREPEHTMFNGVSPFILKHALSSSAKVMLLEQYRMPYAVGRYVSDEFYGRQLQLAACVRSDEYWQQFRRRRFAHFSDDEHLIFESVFEPEESGGLANFRRVASAQRIVEMIAGDGYGQYSHAEIAVLTPFNSQVYLLRQLMKLNGLQDVTVSTTHRQQGAQYPLVFFDPVDGNGAFMRSAIGDSIINVAVSRAQSKLVAVGSDLDCRNPRLLRLHEYSQLPGQLLGT
jgi:hypothetical protein